MFAGAAPHGGLQVTQEDHVGRAGERGTTWIEGEGERVDGLRGRGSLGVLHHEGLEYRRTRLRIEGFRFLAAWGRGEEKVSEIRQRESRKRRTKLRLHLG